MFKIVMLKLVLSNVYCFFECRYSLHLKIYFLQHFQCAQSAQNFQISIRSNIRMGIPSSDENTLCLIQIFRPI
jgi:hypothetical protein